MQTVSVVRASGPVVVAGPVVVVQLLVEVKRSLVVGRLYLGGPAVVKLWEQPELVAGPVV